MISRDFQTWYDRKKFGSRNDHGAWNGMNLMGINPLDFFNAWRARRIDSFQAYFAQLPTAVRLRIPTHRVPDFVTRYPALLTKPIPLGGVAGWEIRCTWTGLPLGPLEVMALPAEQPSVIEVDANLVKRERSKSIVVSKRGTWVVGKDLETVLQQLFGLR
jgi:hypothetical protein